MSYPGEAHYRIRQTIFVHFFIFFNLTLSSVAVPKFFQRKSSPLTILDITINFCTLKEP